MKVINVYVKMIEVTLYQISYMLLELANILETSKIKYILTNYSFSFEYI